MPSGRHGKYNQFEHRTVAIDALADTRNFYFYTDVPYRFEAMTYAADACDDTDKFTPALAYSFNGAAFVVIATGTACATADTVTNYTTLASTAPLGGVIPAGSTIRLTITPAGTAANVLGVTVVSKFSIAH